ncbi:MAG: YqhA family protein [Sulfuricurvum sp.]|nr:YqhA family protein [Sulfuricurvum sp.]
MNLIESIFEGALWKSRFFTLFAVIFSLMGSIVLFLVASMDIWQVVLLMRDMIFFHVHPANLHENVVASIIGAIDLYLIAVVLLIFSLGIYELFISKIDEAEKSSSNILQIHSLDQLKDKIAKVIIMVLVVSFFQKVLHTPYTGALEMLYFSGSILLLALALYFLNKGGNH